MHADWPPAQVDLLNDVPIYNVRGQRRICSLRWCPERAPRGGKLVVNGESVGRARVFSDVQEGQVLWYENSRRLVEIAVNRGSAAKKLDLEPGTAVEWAS